MLLFLVGEAFPPTPPTPFFLFILFASSPLLLWLVFKTADFVHAVQVVSVFGGTNQTTPPNNKTKKNNNNTNHSNKYQNNQIYKEKASKQLNMSV